MWNECRARKRIASPWSSFAPPYSALLGSVALFGHPSTPHVVIEKPLLSQNGRSSCCFSSGSSCKLTAPLLWVALLLLCLQRAHRLDRRGKSTLNHLLRSRQLGSRNLLLVSFFPRSRAFTRTQCALIVMIKWEMGNVRLPRTTFPTRNSWSESRSFFPASSDFSESLVTSLQYGGARRENKE